MKKPTTAQPQSWSQALPTRLLIVLMQVVGLYTYPSRTKGQRSFGHIFATAWSGLMAAWAILFTAFDLTTYSKNYAETGLKQKDFFTYTFFAYRALFDLKVFICICIIYQKTPRIYSVIARLSGSSVEVSVRKVAWSLVAFAILSTIIVCATLHYRFSKYAQKSFAVFGHRFESYAALVDSSLFGTAPFYSNLIIYQIGCAVTYLVDILPILFTVLLAGVLTHEFKKVNMQIRSLLSERLNQHCVEGGEQTVAQQLEAVQRRQLFLGELVGRWDSCVRQVVLLGFITALVGFICWLTLIVRPVKFDKDPDLINAMFPAIATIIGTSGTAYAILGFFAIRLNETAYESAELVSALGPLLCHPIARLNATETLSRFRADPVTLTVGKFLPLNRELLTTVFALLLSYVIVIYQIVDEKQDMKSMLKKSEGLMLTREVVRRALCTANVTFYKDVNLTLDCSYTK